MWHLPFKFGSSEKAALWPSGFMALWPNGLARMIKIDD